MATYGNLNKDTWSIIINCLPETHWKNFKCLNKSFEKLIKSDLMIKKQSFSKLCKYGHIESLLIFIKNNPIQYWNRGLFYACLGNHKEIINIMYCQGANEHKYGLFGACQGGNKNLINAMISMISEKCCDRLDYWNYCMLYASRGGHINIVKWLINNKGADDFNMGLEGACQGKLNKQAITNAKKLINLMIKNGADDLGMGLYRACNQGNKEIVNYMINKGANYYSLSSACYGGNKEIIDIIDKKGRETYNDGMANSCEQGNKEIVEYMIHKGANDWNYGLRRACLGNSLEIVKIMIEKGGNNWNESLAFACCGGCIEIVKLMINMGATDFESGLKNACLHGHLKVVKYMIFKGAKNLNKALKKVYNGLENSLNYNLYSGSKKYINCKYHEIINILKFKMLSSIQ